MPVRQREKPFGLPRPESPHGQIVILEERCKGCGFCVEYCPHQVLAVAKRYNAKGYHPPEIVKVATEDYREDEDLLLRFIEDSCEVHHDAEVGAALLYQAYTNWSAAMNIKPMSGTAFGRKMSVRYQKAKGRLGAFYTGLKLAL